MALLEQHFTQIQVPIVAIAEPSLAVEIMAATVVATARIVHDSLIRVLTAFSIPPTSLLGRRHPPAGIVGSIVILRETAILVSEV
jgi:hypothetical protein